MTILFVDQPLASAGSAKYCLQGPLADRKGCEEHVLIVGAGMAGLTSALLLLEAGHRSGTWEAQGETVG